MGWFFETDFNDAGLVAQNGVEDLIWKRNGFQILIEEQNGGGITVDPSGTGLVKADPVSVLSDEKPGLMIRFNPGILGQITVRALPIPGQTPRVTYGAAYPYGRYGQYTVYEKEMPSAGGDEYAYASNPAMVFVRIVGATLDYIRIDQY
jgi:hypothetical protein